jgi:hypothetical protein
MISVFLLMCFNPAERMVCNATPVPSLAVCHALIRATDKFGRDSDPTHLNFYPNYRCVSIRSK